MEVIQNTTNFKIPYKTAIAIGKFDGVHLGHQLLLKELFHAKTNNLKTAVFTFDPSPAAFFSGKVIPELSTREEKRYLFERLGVDYLVEYPFGEKTAAISPREYVNEFLLKKMNGALIVAGEDVSFGDKGAGDRALLEQMADEQGFSTKIIPKITFEGRNISSTYVREMVLKGDMEMAEKLLGEPYSLMGRVERGNQLGRVLGMPTANIYPTADKLLPPRGVYFVRAELDGKNYPGVMNIGSKPTVSDKNQISAETYLLDFQQDIYGKNLKISMLHYERAEQRFENIDLLKRAIAQNIQDAEQYFLKDTGKS